YPWGDSVPKCDGVVLAREADGFCHDSGGNGPQRAGSGGDDQVHVDAPDVVVMDLAGNVSEWTADAFTPQAELAKRRIWIDPSFEPEFDGKLVVRGGSFRSSLVLARAAARFQQVPLTQRDDLGFRCARPVEGGTLQ